MSIGVNQSHVKNGRTVKSVSEMPSPAPNHKPDLHRQPKQKDYPNSMVPTVAETTQPIKVLHAVGAYRALCTRCAKSWLFSTTGSSVSSED